MKMKHLVLLWLTCFLGYGADITPGYTFANGEQNITHSKLNSAAAGTVSTTFYSGKTAKAIPGDGDYFLILDNAVSPAAYKRITWKGLYTNLLTEAWSSNTVSTADWLLFYNGTTYYKGLASQLLTNGYPTVTSNTLPSADAFLAAIISNQWVKVAVSNVGWESKVNLGNLSEQANPSNAVKFLVSDGNSNSVLSATNLVGGWAESTNDVADADQIVIYNAASNNLAKITMAAVRAYMTNDYGFQKYVGSNNVPGAAAALTNAHGMSGIPHSVRVTLVCTNADLTWAAGEEVDIPTVTETSAANEPAFAVSVSSSNVVVIRTAEASTLRIPKRDGSGRDSLTATNWNLKIHAIYAQ